MSTYWLGKKRTKEDRAKLSESHKGKNHTEEHKRKIGISQKGKIMSQESRKKMSLARIGIKYSDETKERMQGFISGIMSKGRFTKKDLLREISIVQKVR